MTLKKRNSIKQKYSEISIRKEESKEDEINQYSDPCFYDHYFMTAEGNKALS